MTLITLKNSDMTQPKNAIPLTAVLVPQLFISTELIVGFVSKIWCCSFSRVLKDVPAINRRCFCRFFRISGNGVSILFSLAPFQGDGVVLLVFHDDDVNLVHTKFVIHAALLKFTNSFTGENGKWPINCENFECGLNEENGKVEEKEKRRSEKIPFPFLKGVAGDQTRHLQLLLVAWKQHLPFQHRDHQEPNCEWMVGREMTLMNAVALVDWVVCDDETAVWNAEENSGKWNHHGIGEAMLLEEQVRSDAEIPVCVSDDVMVDRVGQMMNQCRNQKRNHHRCL